MKFYHLVLSFVLSFPASLIAQSWVTSVVPAQNQVHVEWDAELTMTFSQDLDPATVTEQTIKVIGSQTGFYGSASLSYDSVSRTVRFQPDRAFLAGETISISLTTSIRDLGGLAMPVPFSWQITAKASPSTGVLSVSSTVAVASVPYSIAAGDLDDDGDLDLVTTNRASNRIALLINSGLGSFENVATVAVGQVPEYVIVGDLDADGDLDLAVANANSNTISILVNDGNANFSPGSPVAVLNGPHTVNTGDIDGDGDLDLVGSNFASGRMSILMNDGTGNFVKTSDPTVGNGPELGIIGDLDGDGDFDLAVPNFGSGSVFLLRNNGSGTFAGAGTINTGTSPHLPGAGDLDNDGDLDLIITNTNSVSILSNNGSGTFSTSTISSAGRPWSGTAADLDGDGDLDLAVTKYSSNRVSIFVNDDGLTETTQIDVGTRPHLVVQGDFDSDGAIDLAVANDGSNSVSILKNELITSVALPDEALPSDFALRQNYPNPFNPSTRIEYSLPVAGHTNLVIYDLLGSPIRTLVNALEAPGLKSVTWDGRNDAGFVVPAGLYFYQLRAGSLTQTRSMLLVK